MLRVLLYGRQVLATRLNISVVNLRFFIIVWDELNHDYFWSKFCQTKLTSANFFLLRKSMKTSTLVISMDFCSPRRLVDSSGWYFSLNLCNIKQNVSVVIQIYSTFHAKHFWYQNNQTSYAKTFEHICDVRFEKVTLPNLSDVKISD